MTSRSSRALLIASILASAGILTFVAYQLPVIAAGGLLHPLRHRSLPPTPAQCTERAFAGEGITLQGWDCRAQAPRRGTIIYLHGTADNRGSGAGVIRRYASQGFDVIAYDSRRHGLSDGEACTYGFFEKRDLSRVIDTLPPGPIVLFGTSLGAAVALQEAANDSRITAIVAVEVFSTLESIARYRAPRLLPEFTIQNAFNVAEKQAGFSIGQVSPVDAARSIRVPVLLIHGAQDADTPPNHSRRVFDALAGPRRLILVDGAGHNESLGQPATWNEIDRWIERVLDTSR